MSARLEYIDKEIWVYLDGEIDHHSAALIRAGIDDAIVTRSPRMLILDFGGVSFMDSSAIGLVMGRYKLINTLSGKVKVVNLSPSAYKIMKLSGLEKIAEMSVR